jgi:hypothetical protein
LETHVLACHSDSPARGVRRIEARILSLDDNWLRLRWRIEGCAELVLPSFAGKGRADELWRTTCFEFFLMPNSQDGYIELNLAPSERWAAYTFSGYREGMSEHAMPREPDCAMRVGANLAIFDAAVPSQTLPEQPWRYGLSAVIEEEGGIISYWAIAHPPGKPDFHHPTCFAATLPPPQ